MPMKNQVVLAHFFLHPYLSPLAVVLANRSLDSSLIRKIDLDTKLFDIQPKLETTGFG